MTSAPLRPSVPPPPCLGDELSAFVDGELDHPGRERVQAHLAHCTGCRAEVESQRRLKVVIAAVPGPPPGVALTARLLGLTVPGVEPAARAAGWAASPAAGPVRPARLRRAGRPPTRDSGARRRSGRRRRSAVGGTLVLIGLGAALVLGGPRSDRPSMPLDPTTDVFVTDYTGSAPGPALPVGADLAGTRR